MKPCALNAAASHLEELGLESREGTADPEVELLAGVHAAGLVLVGLHQAVHGRPDIPVRDRRETRTEDGLWSGDGAELQHIG